MGNLLNHVLIIVLVLLAESTQVSLANDTIKFGYDLDALPISSESEDPNNRISGCVTGGLCRE